LDVKDCNKTNKNINFHRTAKRTSDFTNKETNNIKCCLLTNVMGVTPADVAGHSSTAGPRATVLKDLCHRVNKRVQQTQ
jgi:hypothetical protein